MKPIRRILMLTLVIALCCGASEAATLHVAPSGDDANPGTQEKPLATLAGARDTVRKIKNATKESITVLLHGGTYYLNEPLVLNPSDSGTSGAPINWKAWPGDTPIISGGARLYLKWQRHVGNIVMAKVPAAQLRQAAFDQVFVDGRRLAMARYPNFDPQQRILGGTAADAISPQRVKRWKDPTTAYVHILNLKRWDALHFQITGVNTSGEPILQGGWQFNGESLPLHDRYRYVENVFEELDAPGEWFFDKKTLTLYVVPPPAVDMRTARVEVAGLRHLIELRGSQDNPVEHLTYSGLTLTHTARTFMETNEPQGNSDWKIYRGGAFLAEGTRDCAIRNCFFDSVGGNAVMVSRYNRRFELTGCKIRYAGASGICFAGDPGAMRPRTINKNEPDPLKQIDITPGPLTDNYPAQCRVDDCLFHHLGCFEKQTAGVHIFAAAEITLTHSTIHHVPRGGINVGNGCWGGHVIEDNDVFDTSLETGDHGAFNSWGRDRIMRLPYEELWRAVARKPELAKIDACKTTLIRHNRFHCDFGWSIDLDDEASNFLVTDNLCLGGGIKMRDAFFRRVENNVVIGDTLHAHRWIPNDTDVFARNILTLPYKDYYMPARWGKLVDFNFIHDPTLQGRQAERWPEKRRRGKNGDQSHDENSLIGDVGFVDPAQGDFHLRDDSPALKLGFKSFPLTGYGVKTPALRAEAQAAAQAVRVPDVTGRVKPDGTVEANGSVWWLGAKIKAVEPNQPAPHGRLSSRPSAPAALIFVDIPTGSRAAVRDFRVGDLLTGPEGVPLGTAEEFVDVYLRAATWLWIELEITRGNKKLRTEINGP